MIVALVLILLAVGSVAFHLWSPWWSTPIASNWGYIDETINLTFWITGVVYVLVLFFMAYCVWKFQHKEGRRADYEPENNKLEWALTILTTLGVAGMLAPGLVVWDDYVHVPKNATPFEVVGQQWSWSYRLPGQDGKLGTAATQNITDDNPLGVNPNDPNGQDDVLIQGDDLHLELGKPVKVLLRSIDVLHDFYVPQFRAKMDMVPGSVTYFWFTPTRTGTFDILCAELCGVAHHAMRGKVVVDNAADYQTWLQDQETYAQSVAEARNQTHKTKTLASNQKPASPAE